MFSIPRRLEPLALLGPLLLATLAFAIAGSAHAEDFGSCLPITFSLGGGATQTRSIASFDTTSTSSGTYRVAWDLAQGTLDMSHCCALTHTFLQAGDTYDVIGVAPGTLVNLTAELDVDGNFQSSSCGGFGCNYEIDDKLVCNAATDSRTHPVHLSGTDVSFHDALTVPVQLFAGVPVRVDFRIEAWRSSGISSTPSAHAVIHFTDLPPGAGVISCRGFGASVTRANRASWGRLKLRYR